MQNQTTNIDISDRFSVLFKHILKLAMPMAGSRLIQMVSGFIGMIMLAHLGRDVLAASMLMTSAHITILVMFISLLFSTSVVVGQLYGAGKMEEIGAIIRQSCVLALLICIPLVILFLIVDKLMLLFGQNAALIPYIKQFFYALIWGVPAYTILTALQQACYGMLQQRLVIIGNLIFLGLFILIAYVLIYGKWGVPSFGVAGLSYAFVIQAYANTLFLILCFWQQKKFKALAIFKRQPKENWIYLRQIFQIGWPMSLQFGGELLGFFVSAIMIGWLGVVPLAASQVTQQCLFLFIVPMFALAEASGILVSQAVGGQHYKNIKRIGDVCLWASLIIAVIFSVFFMAFPDLLAALYLNIHDPNNIKTVHLIRVLFWIVGLTLITGTLRDVATGTLRGLYDTRFAMWVGIIIIWLIAIPVGYLLAFPAHLGVVGFRLGMVLAFLVGAILVLRRWQKRAKEFAKA